MHLPLGPLHTRANNRDHEIVRARKKVSKGRPKHLQDYIVWSRALICDRALNQMLLQ